MKATEENVVEGTCLIADDGFTCLEMNDERIVQKNEHGLFVKCSAGHHYLDGQLEDGDEYIGFSIKE